MNKIFTAFFTAIMLTITCTAAFAETERYDFPALRAKLTPIKAPEKLKFDAGDEEEAKQYAIAALLQYYNKKLDNAEAYEYAGYIMHACETFDQDPLLIAAMVVNESSARHDAVSRGGDYGLMQVRWRVHQKNIRKKYPHIKKANDMFNPKDNLMVGTEIFSGYHETADEDVRGALMYYSAGNRSLIEKVFRVRARLEKSYLERLRNT